MWFFDTADNGAYDGHGDFVVAMFNAWLDESQDHPNDHMPLAAWWKKIKKMAGKGDWNCRYLIFQISTGTFNKMDLIPVKWQRASQMIVKSWEDNVHPGYENKQFLIAFLIRKHVECHPFTWPQYTHVYNLLEKYFPTGVEV